MTNQTNGTEIAPDAAAKRDSGQPGGGAGRVEYVRGSGVYPMSGPLPEGDAPIEPMASWGQGDRGAAGYDDHGESELHVDSAQGGADPGDEVEESGPRKERKAA